MMQQALSRGRVPQALLIVGEDGSGTLALALATARTLLCERPHRTERTYDSCGECRSCIQSIRLQHANIHFILPLPTGKSATEGELTSAQVDEWKNLVEHVAVDPYAPFRLQGASTIRIAQIRELKRQLALSSAVSGSRIVIIHHAEDMTADAANAFLKSLEEPPPGVIIILTCERPELVLPTIHSRCQELIIPPIGDDALVRQLVAEGRCTHDEAMLTAPFSLGSLSRARSMLSEDLSSERERVVDILRTALRGKAYRMDLVTAIENEVDDRNREHALLLLSLLALWLRDARVMVHCGTSAAIVNVDQADALARFAQGFPTADYDSVLEIVEHAVSDIRRNVSCRLVVLTCMLSLRRVFAEARNVSSQPS